MLLVWTQIINDSPNKNVNLKEFFIYMLLIDTYFKTVCKIKHKKKLNGICFLEKQILIYCTQGLKYSKTTADEYLQLSN